MLSMSAGSTLLILAKLAIVIPLIFSIPGRGVGGVGAAAATPILKILEKSPLTNVVLPTPIVLFMSPLFNVTLAIIQLPVD